MKELRKASAQVTKDFGRLVKSFAKSLKGSRFRGAWVLGYMDAVAGTPENLRSIVDHELVFVYSKGWQAGTRKKA